MDQSPDLQQVAYFMWEADGCPQDCGDRYWRKALAHDAERRDREAAAAIYSVAVPSTDAPSAGVSDDVMAADEPGLAPEPVAAPSPMKAHEPTSTREPKKSHGPTSTHEANDANGSMADYHPSFKAAFLSDTERGQESPRAADLAPEPQARSQAAALTRPHTQSLDATFGWLELARAQVACAVSGMERLAACHSPGEVAVSQGALLCQSIQLMIDHSLRLVDRAKD